MFNMLRLLKSCKSQSQSKDHKLADSIVIVNEHIYLLLTHFMSPCLNRLCILSLPNIFFHISTSENVQFLSANILFVLVGPSHRKNNTKIMHFVENIKVVYSVVHSHKTLRQDNLFRIFSQHNKFLSQGKCSEQT